MISIKLASSLFCILLVFGFASCVEVFQLTYGQSAVGVDASGTLTTYNIDANDVKQQWSLTSSGYVMNVASSLVLDVAQGKTEPRSQVIAWAANGGLNQMWTFNKTSDGTSIVSKASGLFFKPFSGYYVIGSVSFSFRVVVLPTLCDKYSSALQMPNELTFTNTVFGGILNSLMKDSSTARYFDGTFPAGSVNYTQTPNNNNYNNLVGHLGQFFAQPGALNCTDGTVSPYTRANMTFVHRNMPIGITQFNSFNKQAIAFLASAGVTAADQASVLALLQSFKPQICNQPDCFPDQYPNPSICTKYAIALSLTDYDLVDFVVVSVLANITNNDNISPLRHFFDGSIPGTRNFFTDTAAYNVLHLHLTQFFGAALGCQAKNYPAYAGRSLKAAHSNLPIARMDFDLFNQILIDILANAGVSDSDRATVLSVLNNTAPAVCTNCNTSN